jgi:hypothetical protein
VLYGYLIIAAAIGVPPVFCLCIATLLKRMWARRVLELLAAVWPGLWGASFFYGAYGSGAGSTFTLYWAAFIMAISVVWVVILECTATPDEWEHLRRPSK